MTTVPYVYTPTTAGTTFEHLVEAVRHEGVYPTREGAEKVIRTVLTVLGRQVTGEERVEFAAHLPLEAALVFTAQIPAATPLTGCEFVNELTTLTGGTGATTRWDTGSVLRVVNRTVDNVLIDRILTQLPPVYALLFGRSELIYRLNRIKVGQLNKPHTALNPGKRPLRGCFHSKCRYASAVPCLCTITFACA
ncbi:DUF2267 domain-containing protein [Streptomyces sp. SCSIO 30461]|uniref:DUF2267 domain-containing protein n=1 Tax=Streptomyces sp. SCSIO 30461 TaxID=3118085 RepID=UPI0030CBF532